MDNWHQSASLVSGLWHNNSIDGINDHYSSHKRFTNSLNALYYHLIPLALDLIHIGLYKLYQKARGNSQERQQLLTNQRPTQNNNTQIREDILAISSDSGCKSEHESENDAIVEMSDSEETPSRQAVSFGPTTAMGSR